MRRTPEQLQAMQPASPHSNLPPADAGATSESMAIRKGLGGTGLSPIDSAQYPPIPGMEGPFRFPNGRVLYYDPKEGRYYDRQTDMYLDVTDDPSRMRRVASKARALLRRMQFAEDKKVGPVPSNFAGGFTAFRLNKLAGYVVVLARGDSPISPANLTQARKIEEKFKQANPGVKTSIRDLRVPFYIRLPDYGSSAMRKEHFAGSSGPLRSELTPEEMRILQGLWDRVDDAKSRFLEQWHEFVSLQQNANRKGWAAIHQAGVRLTEVESRARSLGDQDLATKAKQMLAQIQRLEQYTNTPAVQPQL